MTCMLHCSSVRPSSATVIITATARLHLPIVLYSSYPYYVRRYALCCILLAVRPSVCYTRVMSPNCLVYWLHYFRFLTLHITVKFDIKWGMRNLRIFINIQQRNGDIIIPHSYIRKRQNCIDRATSDNAECDMSVCTVVQNCCKGCLLYTSPSPRDS